MKINVRLFRVWIGRMLPAVALVGLLQAHPAWTVQPGAPPPTHIDIVGPAGSDAFGTTVTLLPNGNIVVTDPYYDAGATEDVGAVYLYDGATGALISALTGSTAADQIGSYGGVTVLSNGNYVVRSPYWDNGAVPNAGAVTWGSATTGVNGVVSAANSLVGSTAYDGVGEWVAALSNGNYVVLSSFWDNSTVANVGAVTWGNGATGIVGPLSTANSLVGSTASDMVGYNGVAPLSNGNYVVTSSHWDNGPTVDVGAVTWGNGTTGISGVVSVTNSLVGSMAYDWIGFRVRPLGNGNYVVSSPSWDNGTKADVGAATWGNGTTGITGPVSEANSLVGSTAGDSVGSQDVTLLSNGNYLVSSPDWDNGAVVDAGAVTWGNGMAGIAGPVSIDNSLVGSTDYDMVAYDITPLSNGNYVVSSENWDNGPAADAGAATWGNGATGITGPVSAANSLVGGAADDLVGGYDVIELSNGNYVVSSPWWDNGSAADAGAATWCNGTNGTHGVVSAANSLVGSTAEDEVGDRVIALANSNYVVGSRSWDKPISKGAQAANAGAATWGNGSTGIAGPVSVDNSLVGSTAGDEVGMMLAALNNGNYVVSSPHWDRDAIVNAGATTWGSGAMGLVTTVSAANSLVGSTTGDLVGERGAAPLSNGNYVVSSPYWDHEAISEAGAATWGNGTIGITGPVSDANSLVGSAPGDYVGDWVNALSDGNYVVHSPQWDNGGAADAGAVTWGRGVTGIAGPITAENSVRGTTAGGGSSMVWVYDYVNDQLVVGRPADNIVTIFRPDLPVFLVFVPVILRNEP